ncbi:VanZ family protein [Streptomyces spirodelae]|uniref:VanZ family protein n=1 Tax=Streptomyces spirodelae TaxID=2812904 RepID=A0ABS3WUL0_9ACTN|nr:VanZ family protein [Streptomyces spirodelae]MBO8186835.1 VanZ family protein [Streptomyces spirodelae]
MTCSAHHPGTTAERVGVFHDVQRLGSGGPTPSATRIRLAGLLLLAAHLCLVGWLTLRPLSVPWVAPANLHPLASIRSDLAEGPRATLEGIGGGLLLLAPFGVLLPLATGRLHRRLPGTVARTVFAGAMVSVVLTLAQTGVPGHVADIDSVLLNTTGVALSAGLLFPLLRRWLRHRDGDYGGHGDRLGEREQRSHAVAPRGGLGERKEKSQGSTPRTTRVGMAP